jgi:cell division protein FtsJ
MGQVVPKAWVKSRRHDRYYRAAKRQEYRSRSAIKLSQIDRDFGLLHPGDTVVDLGAAPGGWSQIAAERVGPKGRVLAVDLAPMKPIAGVELLRGDFTDGAVQARLFELLGRPADLVLSDMAPHLSGNKSYDEARALGVNVRREKALVIAVATLITAAATSVTGVINWVGLIVPHLVRMAVGADNRKVLPLSAAFGASLLIVADDIARSAASFEIPIGILTSVVGIPFFIVLLKRSGRIWR